MESEPETNSEEIEAVVNGKVTEMGGTASIGGADVAVFRTDENEQVGKATTNTTGSYEVTFTVPEDDAPDQLAIEVGAEGFVNETDTVGFDPSLTRNVSLEAGCDSTGESGFNRDDLAMIDEKISNYMEEREIPGLSIAITKDERLVLAKGYGHANREEGEKVCRHHRFRIASISKPITGIAVMKLVERGELQLDDFVFGEDGILGTQYGTPDYSELETDDPARITVHHLLQHESGWENSGGDPMFMFPQKDQDELISWVLSNRPIQSEPGQSYTYLNFGYSLLGRIIEEVTGKPYEDFVETAVLSPSGADRMAIAGDTRSERKQNEVVYYGRGAYDMQVERMDSHGGWIATPTDLLQFVTRVDGFDRKADILQPSTEREAFDREGANRSYGEGWILGSSWRGHNGAFSGSIGYLVRRDDGISFAVLANTRPSNDRFGNDLRNTVSEIVENINEWPDHDLF